MREGPGNILGGEENRGSDDSSCQQQDRIQQREAPYQARLCIRLGYTSVPGDGGRFHALSDAEFIRGFQWGAAAPADHRGAITAGERVCDLLGAAGTI